MKQKRVKQPLNKFEGLRQWPLYLHRAIFESRVEKREKNLKKMERAVEDTIKDLDKEDKKKS